MESQSHSIEQLVASWEKAEAQRLILGDEVVNSVVGPIREMLVSQARPTDQQVSVAESWATLVETADLLGIEAPEPPTETAEVLAVVERFQKITELLGGAVSDSVSVVGVEDAPGMGSSQALVTNDVAPKEDAISSVRVEEDRVEEEQEVALADDVAFVAAVVDQGETRETESPNRLTVAQGRRELSITSAKIESAVFILQALMASSNGEVRTTDLVKALTGTTSRELEIMRQNGDKSPALKAARAKKDAFYEALAVLRDNGFIQHEKGSPVSEKGRLGGGKSGILRQSQPISITEENGDMRIEIEPEPYSVRANIYDRSIDNGRGKTVEVNRTVEVFRSIISALGAIATRPEVEQKGFSRKNLYSYASVEGPVTSNLADKIEDLVGKFDGDFPLRINPEASSKHSSDRYSFENGSTIEVIDGFPEKPRFDVPVKVFIDGTMLCADFDGEIYLLNDLDLAVRRGNNATTQQELVGRNRSLFATLAEFEKEDELDIKSLVELIVESRHNASDTNRNEMMASWVLRTLQKLNSIGGDAAIVNIRSTQGSETIIDLNHRIIFQEGEGTPDPKA